MARITLVFRHAGPLIMTKKPYGHWRDIVTDYEDYIASLGPWTLEELVEFFSGDFGADDAKWPFSRQEIADFISSDRLITESELDNRIKRGIDS